MTDVATQGHPFHEWAGAYIKAGYWPRAVKGKGGQTGWNRPGPDVHLRLLPEPHLGVALLTGSPLGDGSKLGAIDVDDDRFTRVVRVLLGGTADVPLPAERRGAKGTAIFVRDPCKDAIRRPVKWKVKGFNKNPVEYLFDLLCVVPPSIHPDTGQPYQWLGTPLLELQPEQLVEINLPFVSSVLSNRDLSVLIGGAGTHDAALEFVWHLVHKLNVEDDDLITRIVAAALPANYGGNTLEELPGLITSARNKPYRSHSGWDSNAGVEEPDRALAQLNAKYCILQDGGKAFVHYFDDEGFSILLPFADFHNLNSRRYVLGQDDKLKPVGKWWTSHPKARALEGLTFRPDRTETEVNGKLNLWRGFGVQPVPGNWDLMKRHLLEVVAAGNVEHYDYIISWCAWAVQHPHKPPETALVMVGGKGTGKGTLGSTMCKLFGIHHSIHISNTVHLTGRFNEHQRAACLVFADEAYWPGDKGSEGGLKRMLTESTLFMEPKGRKAVQVQNMTHVIIASNENWVVPAGQHERRFAVFRVSELHRQDPDWFGPLYDEMENGGYEAMLHELLNMDLSDWHPRYVPTTEALVEQQMRNLDPFDDFILRYLEGGVLPGYLLGVSETAKRPDVVLSYSQIDPDGRSLRDGLFDLARERPGLRNIRDKEITEKLRADYGCQSWRSSRFRGWQFPPLLDCRALFEARYPDHQWQYPDIEEWGAGINEDGSDPSY